MSQRFIRLVATWTVPLVFLFLLAPLVVLGNYYDRPRYFALSPYFQTAAAAACGASALVAFRKVRLTPNVLAGLAFMAWSFLSVIWSISSINSLSYTLSLVLFFMALVAAWRADTRIWMNATILIIWCMLILLTAILGFGETAGLGNRGIGGIWPIMTGHFCMATVLFASLLKERPIKTILIAYLVAYLVQSRTTLVELTAFLVLRYAVVGLFGRWLPRQMFIPALVVFALFLVLGLGDLVQGVVSFFNSLMDIDTDLRKDTSLTGRLEYWRVGWETFIQHPIIGFGANTRGGEVGVEGVMDVNAHSGYVNLLLDLGIVGFSLFVLWQLLSLTAVLGIPGRGQARRTRLTVAAFMVANIPILITEPNYFGSYAPGSVTLYFCMMLPVALQSDNRPLFATSRKRRPVAPRTIPSFGRDAAYASRGEQPGPLT